jgi:hypothetical protein
MIRSITLKTPMLRVASVILALGFASAMNPASAKLPAPSDEAKAKAEEAKAKAAENAKKDAELLSKYQDDLATKYAAKQKSEGKEFKPTPIAATAPAPAAAAPTAVPSTVATPAAAAAAAATPKK